MRAVASTSRLPQVAQVAIRNEAGDLDDVDVAERVGHPRLRQRRRQLEVLLERAAHAAARELGRTGRSQEPPRADPVHRADEEVPRIGLDEVDDLLDGAGLVVDLQAQLDRQPACLRGEDRVDVSVERHVQLARHDLVHLRDEMRVRVALPPLPEGGHRLDAAVEVLDERDLLRAARQRDLDVAVDVVGRKLTRRRRARHVTMRMDVEVVVTHLGEQG